MKIKVKDICVILIYILIFISAIAYMRFTLTQVYLWRMIYFFSIFTIIALCIAYKMNKKSLSLDPFVVLLAIIVMFELSISAFKSLFVVPMIFVDVIPWPFILAVFYDYSQNNVVPKCFRKITAWGLSVICLLSLSNIAAQYTSINGGAVFSTYYCFAFLPMLYLTCSRKISLLFSVIVAFLMLISLKRSAFIIVVVGISLYYILLNYIQNTSHKKIHKTIILMIALIVVLFLGQIIIDRLNLNILIRMSSILEDGGSGRVRIWNQVLSCFNSSSWSERLLGHGFHSVFYQIRPLGIARYAHNSLLETLYDYGYIGLVFIIIVMFRIITDTVKMFRKKHAMLPIMGFSVIQMLVLSFVSYFFEQSIIIIPFCVIWGICLGSFTKERKEWESMGRRR